MKWALLFSSFFWVVSSASAIVAPLIPLHYIQISVYSLLTSNNSSDQQQLLSNIGWIKNGNSWLNPAISVAANPDIASEVFEKASANGQQIEFRAHIQPMGNGRVKVTLIKLGRPLVIDEGSSDVVLVHGDHKVLQLPLVAQDNGKVIATVLSIVMP